MKAVVQLVGTFKSRHDGLTQPAGHFKTAVRNGITFKAGFCFHDYFGNVDAGQPASIW